MPCRFFFSPHLAFGLSCYCLAHNSNSRDTNSCLHSSVSRLHRTCQHLPNYPRTQGYARTATDPAPLRTSLDRSLPIGRTFFGFQTFYQAPYHLVAVVGALLVTSPHALYRVVRLEWTFGFGLFSRFHLLIPASRSLTEGSPEHREVGRNPTLRMFLLVLFSASLGLI